MKWVTLDEWYAWWPADKACDATETRYRELSGHYRAISPELYERLERASDEIRRIQAEIDCEKG